MTDDEPFLPAYGAGTLAEVMPSMAAALDVPGFVDTLAVGTCRAAGVLLVDGLGADLLAAHAADAPALTELARGTRALTACFPATTAVSITSLGTGLAPGEHGIEGYSMAVPPLDDPRAEPDIVLNALRWCAAGSPDAVDLLADLPPERVQPRPTVIEQAHRAGVAVHTVAPEFQRHSGLSRAALRGGRFRGVHGLGDLAAEMLDALTVAGDERALCYGYHGELDMLGHLHGPGSLAWRLQLSAIDATVAAIVERLPPGAVLLVVADHGMITTGPDRQIDLDASADLLAGVRRMAGEPRVRHVHAAAGAGHDVLATWRETLGDSAWVLGREDAAAAGWFGPAVDDVARGRIGDVVAAARGSWTLVRGRAEPRESALVGHHGSLTAAEQRVPLIVCR